MSGSVLAGGIATRTAGAADGPGSGPPSVPRRRSSPAVGFGPATGPATPGSGVGSDSRGAVLGGVAVLATAVVLRPLLVGASWWFAVAVGVALVVGTGAVARRLRMPAPLVVLAQAVVSGAWVVFLGGGDSLRGGLLPTRETPGAVRDQVDAAFELVNTAAPPVVTGTGLLLLVCGGLGLVAIVVDHLVVTWRVPALAALPLLGVHVVTMVCAPGGVGSLDFVVAAGGFLALVLLAPGRSTRGQDGHGGGAGVRIGLAAVSLAVVLAAVLPGLGVGAVYHLGYHQPTVDGEGVGDGGGSVLVVRDPMVQLRRNLTQPQDVDVLTYRTSDGSLPYLRLRTLEAFDGRRWTAGPRDLQPADEPFPAPSGVSAGAARTTVTTTAKVADGLRSQFLPVPYPASAVRVDGPWNVDTRDLDVVSLTRGTSGGLEYTVESTPLEIDPERLRSATGSIPTDIRDQDLALPAGLPTEVTATARRVTAGADTAYDRAVALQEWFRTDFAYDVTYAEGTSNGALARFLTDKRGYCEQFAATMAVMARELGIPARVVTGFLPGGSSADGNVTVTARDAHAWPELWFPGNGWVRFEPTPATRTGNAPAYATPAPTAIDPAAPGASASAAPVAPRTGPEETDAGPAAEVTDTAGATAGRRIAVGAGVVGAGAVLLLGPHVGALLWWRRRRAAARARGGAAAQVELAWDEVRSALVEAGSRWEGAASPRAAARTVLSVVAAGTPTTPTTPTTSSTSAAASPEVAAAVGRLVRLAERVRYGAPGGAEPDLSTLRADVSTVVHALRAVSPRRSRLIGFLLPEPVRRLRPGLPTT